VAVAVDVGLRVLGRREVAAVAVQQGQGTQAVQGFRDKVITGLAHLQTLTLQRAVVAAGSLRLRATLMEVLDQRCTESGFLMAVKALRVNPPLGEPPLVAGAEVTVPLV
jgi:hypothetical protein